MEVIRVRGDTTLRMYRGDTKEIPIVTKKDGKEAFIETLQGYTVTLTIRDRRGRVVLQKEDIIDGTRIDMTIVPDEAESIGQGFYDYDIELQSPSGQIVTTLVKGRWIV